jgi:hypothetical protein
MKLKNGFKRLREIFKLHPFSFMIVLIPCLIFPVFIRSRLLKKH